ncbi:hypothetical protein K502DRAFT_367367 [Neoconidiobolus thromboides FSU 785]|nr:hypothetical protein K502DRAFT_367367 [Neoconidiobolus thromboides FSU 785]
MYTIKSIRAISRVQVRHFTSPTKVAQADLIKDLFVKELKGFKPSATGAASDIAPAKEFKLPVAPQAPKFDEDIAADLATYDAEEVVKA